MDYFKQVKAFYELMLISPLTSPEIALWHAILHLNNRSGWPSELNVPLSTLEFLSGLSTAGVKRARNALTVKGLLQWKSRGGKQSAVYTLVALYEPQGVPQDVPNPVPQDVPNPVPQSEPIYKHKTKTKTYSSSSTRVDAQGNSLSRLVSCYEQNVGVVPRSVFDGFSYWLTELPEEVIAAAIREAAYANARNWNYVHAILKRCKDNGIQSLDSFELEKSKHAEKKRKRGMQVKQGTGNPFVQILEGETV